MSSSDLDFLESSKSSLNFLNSVTSQNSLQPIQSMNFLDISSVQEPINKEDSSLVQQIKRQKQLILRQKQEINRLKNINLINDERIQEYQDQTLSQFNENQKIIQLAQQLKQNNDISDSQKRIEQQVIFDLLEFIKVQSQNNQDLIQGIYSTTLNAQSYILAMKKQFDQYEIKYKEMKKRINKLQNDKLDAQKCLLIQSTQFQQKLSQLRLQ
ncbi:hypothetical protein SS50377_22281 [Spironucleus salmonicida]|uniref:Uncharacterized protein n=1 Tax=Spironucleus salmonicida TaxID=348837 RepID=V6LCL9_9EUKA|nr:hypothetical protein SS50377_22281 [Spironucleus salmonicida]|eukprot:EST42225.1 Hypothetical protein SS50377_18527 [Spironucleus salmonicida]